MKHPRIAAVAAGATALTAASVLIVTAHMTAVADTPNCVSHVEFDAMEYGLTVNQVANRFDVYGVYDGDTDTHFRRAYTVCWAPDTRQAVVVYSYATGWSNSWYVRDI